MTPLVLTATMRFRAPPRKPRSTATFAPSHATPPPYLRHQYRGNGGCRDRPVSSAVIIAPAPGSQALVTGTARQLGAVSRSGTASPAPYFCRSTSPTKLELMNSIIGREVSFHE
ncbi:hypothetical protein NKI41_17610 [Mesorhizobium sp. M0601]|uniref:hypothetical protein n=1 Tax=Mesorhizobium sp. M0601 TaxID=2956969 RepID=UPI003338CDD3